MKTHLKDPTVSGQTYSCGVCDKVFREDVQLFLLILGHGQYSYVLIRTGTAFSFITVEQLFFHRGLRSQPPIVSFSKLNIFSVDVCV